MSNPYPPPYGSDPYQQPQAGYSQPQGGYSQPQGDYSQYQQPGYSQPAYGQPAYGQPQQVLVAQPQTNNKALISLILGIASWVVGSILTGIPAVIIGHMAMKEIDRSGGTQGGKPLAIIGLILGYLSIAGVVGACIFFVFIIGAFGAAGAAGAH